MKLIQLIILSCCVLLAGCGDYGKLERIERLPPVMEEVSGIENIAGSNLIWMINDSGNENEIYGINSEGELERTVVIKNAENKDWEDLAKDSISNIYIGDFGNNENKRKDLAIYKIEDVANINSNETEAQRIDFFLEDQEEFPPEADNRNFDIEAFVVYRGYFYLFSKSRSYNTNGISKLYKLPNKAGKHKAVLIDEFKTCKDNSCRITAASFNKDFSELVLLSNDRVWHITNFTDNNFLEGRITMKKFNHNSQKESVCFKNENTLYITDEQNEATGRNLYEFDLSQMFSEK